QAKVRMLGGAVARLTLRDPLPLHVADRVLLRDPGASREQADPDGGRDIWPGLFGAVVLDIDPPPLTRRGAATAAAAELAAWPSRPAAADLVRRRGLAAAADLTAMGVTDQPEPVAAGWLADSDHWAGLAARLGAIVAEHAEREPLAPGLPVEAAREALRLPDRRLVLALASAAPSVTATAGVLTVGTRPDSLPPALAASVASLLADLADRPFDAPDATRLSELGLEKRDLAAAARLGALLRLTDQIVLAPGAGERAAQILAGLDQPFTAAAARVALGSTRRTVIPLLEHLDRLRLTQRLPDDRRRIRG
ncbi:MAG TPA: SelB C-terminal domain-containing protein, partial [Streptosporangiaceae bacterium]|nr:SelB C-terminal domain-containing protein [Streptosporangiaceae bacterium]